MSALKFKFPHMQAQFESRPKLLKELALLFVELSHKNNIDPTITRILDRVQIQESGVHPAGRAIDFRDLYGGKHLYPIDVRESLLKTFNNNWKRKDGRPTLLHHTGTADHFHLQIPASNMQFFEDPFEALKRVRQELAEQTN